ncbi:MAG: hypothetical protein ACM3YE_12760 [Bacteroidota bacterium]
MAKSRSKIDQRLSNQLSLFDTVVSTYYETIVRPNKVEAGSINIGNQLRNLLSEGLKQCQLSRWEVAAKMSELLDVEITKSQLDSWTAESKEAHRFPAEYLPAFCRVTGYLEPLRLMAELVGCYLLESKEALLADLGKIDHMKRNLTKREKEIREFLNKVAGDSL